MSPMSSCPRPLRFLVPAFLLAAISCKSTSQEPVAPAGTGQQPAAGAKPAASPKPAVISNDYAADAQVVAVSKEDRRITFRRDDGALIEVLANDDVRNFEQIQVGDVLHVRYREAMRATLLPPGENVKVTNAAFGAARAPTGAKPGAGAGYSVSARVKILGIDRENQVVTFATPTGDVGARKVQTEQGREFVKGLKAGDIVQLDFAESLALEIKTK